MSASEPVAAAEPTQIGRRAFLTRSVVAGAGLIVGPALIAACSGTTASTAPSAGASTAASAAASAAPSAAASAVSAAPSVAASPSAAASAAITPNQATTLKDFKPYVPNPTAGSKPPVPNSFSYFVPSASEYFTGLSDAAKQAAADRKIEYGGMVLSDADPVKNIDQMNTALQKGIGGPGSSPMTRSPRARSS